MLLKAVLAGSHCSQSSPLHLQPCPPPVSMSHKSTTGIALPAASVGGDRCGHGGNLIEDGLLKSLSWLRTGVLLGCLKAGPGSLGDV